MKFELEKTISIIERTPGVLNALLLGIPDEWVMNNEGENTWSAFDVIGHLIVCEKTNFITRTEIILSGTGPLTKLDRIAHIEYDKGKSPAELLKEFEQLRKENITRLQSFHLTDSDLLKTAVHPQIGKVNLKNLLATWVAHDLNHLSQVARIMARQYQYEVGPFIEFLSILKIK